MINHDLIEQKILESGLKKGYLAEQLCVSRQHFIRLCNGERDITNVQINKLCRLLGITSIEEKEKIFFSE